MKIEHVLCPVDFGPSCAVALEGAVAVATDYGADLTLLHVLGPFGSKDEEEEAALHLRASELLRGLVQGKLPALRAAHGFRGTILAEVARGAVADEIVAAAERLGAQAIVLAPRPRPAWSAALPGTTELVVRRARCPVLVVRAPAWVGPRFESEIEDTERLWGMAA